MTKMAFYVKRNDAHPQDKLYINNKNYLYSYIYVINLLGAR